jgi:hypothetical protein
MGQPGLLKALRTDSSKASSDQLMHSIHPESVKFPKAGSGLILMQFPNKPSGYD